MKLNRINFIEKFALVTFPVALVVGCTTTTDQPKTATAHDASLSHPYEPGHALPYTSTNTSTDTAPNASLTYTTKRGEIMNFQNHTVAAFAKTSDGVESANTVYNDKLLEVKVRLSPNQAMQKPAKSLFHFAANKYDLNGADLEILRQHAHYLKAHTNLTLYVDGFSDNRGPAFANYQLSKKRAQQVADLLKSYGAPASQIKVNGYGESFPLKSEKNWNENRRVELEYIDSSASNDMLAIYR